MSGTVKNKLKQKIDDFDSLVTFSREFKNTNELKNDLREFIF